MGVRACWLLETAAVPGWSRSCQWWLSEDMRGVPGIPGWPSRGRARDPARGRAQLLWATVARPMGGMHVRFASVWGTACICLTTKASACNVVFEKVFRTSDEHVTYTDLASAAHRLRLHLTNRHKIRGHLLLAIAGPREQHGCIYDWRRQDECQGHHLILAEGQW